mmetsp:Transcript_31109/g.69111  ORF Transcript_31109/g.69111 Transcript_31109/m.69111 type:complete len:325 (+) Transcript_31109:342-1316(+)
MSGQRKRALLVGGTGMALFPLEGDPFAPEVVSALARVGFHTSMIEYCEGDQALAEKLNSGDYCICVILGLGSGTDFSPRRPTAPWKSGPWRQALTSWVEAGGVMLMQGERAAAHVMREWFAKPWTMDGDYYRRTDHALNPACAVLTGAGPAVLQRLPRQYNVKACMVNCVPREECIYGAATGAVAQSLVPGFGGMAVDRGMCAVAAGQYGRGTVVFWGDVNYEPDTLTIVVQLALRLVPTGVQPGGSGAAAESSAADSSSPVHRQPLHCCVCGATDGGDVKVRYCAACKAASSTGGTTVPAYCSRECQRTDWRQGHKQVCWSRK